MRSVFLAGSLGALVITAGVAMAVVHEMRASAADVAAAARVAIKAVGGDRATLATPTEQGAAWQFRVTSRDGSTDVTLDRDLNVLRVEELRSAQSVRATEEYVGLQDEPIAQAEPAPAPAPWTAPAPRPAWRSYATADFERAAQVALEAAGGGTVHDVDRENEAGSTWEVELTAADGRYLEIQLDAQFNVLFMGSERDAHEGPGDREDEGEGYDDD